MSKTFITIGVNSLDESVSFYKEQLNFNLEKSLEPTENIKLVWLKDNNDFWIELIKRDDMPEVNNRDTSFSLCITELDLSYYENKFKTNGVEFNKLILSNGKNVLRLKDPNNLNIALMD